MIDYDPGVWSIGFSFSLTGSVFPKSFCVAFPCSALTVLLHWVVNNNAELKEVLDLGSTGSAVLGGFSFILGFLVVFRSQQAYARWWEGGSLLQQISGEWINAFSSLIAFCDPDPAKRRDVDRFQHTLLRLMSMLHGSALQEVATLEDKTFEFVELSGIDVEKLNFMQESHDPCGIVLQWLQRLIHEANDDKIIKVAPPILSRVYNQLGNGIVKLSDCRKMSEFQIPFPLAQMITIMLLVHWCTTAIVCATSVVTMLWAGILSFLLIMSYWSINYIAVELEMPFGDDLNDLPLHDLQRDMNSTLVNLMDRRAHVPPSFDYNPDVHDMMCRMSYDMDALLGPQIDEEQNLRVMQSLLEVTSRMETSRLQSRSRSTKSRKHTLKSHGAHEESRDTFSKQALLEESGPGPPADPLPHVFVVDPLVLPEQRDASTPLTGEPPPLCGREEAADTVNQQRPSSPRIAPPEENGPVFFSTFPDIPLSESHGQMSPITGIPLPADQRTLSMLLVKM